MGSFERVTLVGGELRAGLFNLVMQPNWSILEHFGLVAARNLIL
jgi:hypothetical protein